MHPASFPNRQWHKTPKKRYPKQVSVQPPPMAVKVTLPAFPAERRRLLHSARSAPAAIDQYILPARRSAANPPHAAAAVDRPEQTDGRTDGWTFDRYIDPAHAYYAGGVNKPNCHRDIVSCQLSKRCCSTLGPIYNVSYELVYHKLIVRHQLIVVTYDVLRFLLGIS